MKNNTLSGSNFNYDLSPELNNTMQKILSFHKKWRVTPIPPHEQDCDFG